MPSEIEATYRVVTPLFCAGADQRRAEVRLPSFKGMLRFWWRALAWSRMDGNLNAVREQEDSLFGSAGGGQSRLSIQLSMNREPKQVDVETVLEVAGRVVGEGARYLGYGVMEAFASRHRDTKAGQLTRPCLRAPFDFTVSMRLRERGLIKEERKGHLASLEKALISLGTQGGMGARSRKGYGSLVLRSLVVDGEQRWRSPQTLPDLCDVLATLRCGSNAVGQPEYTALSEETRHLLVSSTKKEATELLDLVGRELMRYRSWGHNGKVLGQLSERNFRDDHDLMNSNRRNRHPRRIAFGLPHNYGSRPDQQVGPYDKDRRASPLFIHIHECSDTPVAVLSFLPARFLPKGKSDISVGGSRIRQTPEADLYQPIHGFLNRLLDREKRKERFTDVVEVKS